MSRVKNDREKRDTALFDSIAAGYGKKDMTPSSSFARKTQLLSAISLLGPAAGRLGTVVEIGCGIGASAKYLDGKYDRYIGMDLSSKLIELAREFNSGNDKATFLEMNIKDPDLGGVKADTVLSVGVLHHLDDLDAGLSSLRAVARAGTKFIAIEPQNGNPGVRLLRALRSRIDAAYSKDQIFFSEQALVAALERNGIETQKVSYEGFFSAPFAQVILRPQTLFTPLSKLAVKLDFFLIKLLGSRMRHLSFNMIVLGTFRI
jgi:SAM-dependent methyltransferase